MDNTKKQENMRLFQEYPFIVPREERDGYNGDTPTVLDQMPAGWRNTFGDAMCASIKRALPQERLDEYTIRGIGTGFGFLNLDDEGGNEVTEYIKSLYENISWFTCKKCGYDFKKQGERAEFTRVCPECGERRGAKL